jgi:imidazolonepropionase-like amidohydrolase
MGWAASAVAQLGERAIPGVYAITNARVVRVAAPTLDRGTVVIRDGLIAAVGTGIPIPADARVIDGAGLTVYPGFIDALTHVSIPAPRQGTAGGPAFATAATQQARLPTAPNSVYPPGLQPELSVVDFLDVEGDALDAHRGAGFTTVVSAPRSGILQGQSALLNLAGDNVQDMIVRSPIALHVGFTATRGSTYPNSLLGVFSSLRQMLLDAQRYRDLNAAYARNPRGMRRPDNDPSLAALGAVLTKELPVIMLVSSEREIDRALDLATEFGLRAYIAGGEEGWRVADRLRRENVPVIASLDFPRRRGDAAADADPEPLRVLRGRVEAPRNPGRLAAAGVRLAFTSGGASMSDVLANVRKAVSGGLSRDQAVRALTLTPAELFGVSDRLGSIEPGKIANLTLVRGDLFDAAARVSQVFIDGRPITVRAPAADSPAATGASGTWTITATFAEGDRTITLNLQQDGERLRGTIQGALGSADIGNASIGSGGDLRFTAPVTLGNTTEEATFSGTLTGNIMRGTVQIVGQPNGTFVGTRPESRAPDGARRRPPDP